MKQPFFSVIVPVYNRERFIDKCLQSILDQTFDDFEIIVVDDGSSDNTKSIITTFNDARIKYHYYEHSGVSSARNKGLHLASGKFIAFLDSDDWWKPNKLQKGINYINNFPEIKIFHTEEIWYKNGVLFDQKKKHKNPDGFVYKNILPLCCISMSTIIMERSVFNDIGYFDETLEACEDYDLFLRATSKYKVKLISEPLTLKDGGRPDQLSFSIWGLDRFRIKALQKMLNSKDLDNDLRDATIKELQIKCAIYTKGCLKHGRSAEEYTNCKI
ncbi:MAG: glycosyltransferase [Candidatus Omnitrophica bacterium]|nr:glycosyltransferase [Candidatus Omnitrophota bacterium]